MPEGRLVYHRRPYWLQMRVPFTATLGEQKTAFTDTQGADYLVRGAWSDLVAARVRFVKSGSKDEFSTVQVPIAAQTGSSGTVTPMMAWDVPFVLAAKAPLQGLFLNSGAEGPGTVAFIAEKINLERPDQHVRVEESRQGWLMLDLGNTSKIATTDPIDDDCLVWGATTNCADAIEILMRDTDTRITWSEETIPVRALAGVEGQPQPVMRYPRPMFLKKYIQLRAEFNTAVTGNYVAFRIERIKKPKEQPNGESA